MENEEEGSLYIVDLRKQHMSKIEKAIANNNGLYEAVFRNFKISSQKNENIWYSLEKVPPLYSNLVTLSRNWVPDTIFEQIDKKSERDRWNEWSIKDSFAVLNLEKIGLKKLFDAKWMYLEDSKFKPSENLRINFEIVSDENGLRDWKSAWGSYEEGEDLADQIFDSSLLFDKDIFLVAAYKNEKLESGCLVNRTDDVLGISNFFSPNQNYWSATIEFIKKAIGRNDIVGYESNLELIERLRSLGFDPLGDLSVWLKKSPETQTS